ncbi:hypothetical protein CXF29_00220 [Corynebacterium bovis]|nr:hypothetical protein CXF29_00220 [Corynebacterium bovis]
MGVGQVGAVNIPVAVMVARGGGLVLVLVLVVGGGGEQAGDGVGEVGDEAMPPEVGAPAAEGQPWAIGAVVLPVGEGSVTVSMRFFAIGGGG